jgi:hypothetical protein
MPEKSGPQRGRWGRIDNIDGDLHRSDRLHRPHRRSATMRETYLAGDPLEARRRLVAFDDDCARSEVSELERLSRTIARWEASILRWQRTHLTNAATEGTNVVIKNIKRLGFGFRNFDKYRLRLLLRCGAPWQTRQVASIRPANHASAGREPH